MTITGIRADYARADTFLSEIRSNPNSMGSCLSSGQPANQDLFGADDEAGAAKKLLLMGTGEAGKTTFSRQVHRLFGDGLPEEVRKSLVSAVLWNVIEGTQVILNKYETYDLKHDEETRNCQKVISSYTNDTSRLSMTFFPEEITKVILNLKKRNDFREVLERGPEFHLPESYATYIERLTNYPEWAGKNWVPSEDDTLRVRIRTIGAITTHFKLDGQEFELCDLAGQRGERFKWLSHFEGVDGLVYVASLGDYDQSSFEDNKGNRLKDSLDTWAQHVQHNAFTDSQVLLLLNKKDLLKSKFCEKQVPIPYRDQRDKKYNPPKFDPTKTSDENLEIVESWFRELFLSFVPENKLDSVSSMSLIALNQEDVERCVNQMKSRIMA